MDGQSDVTALVEQLTRQLAESTLFKSQNPEFSLVNQPSIANMVAICEDFAASLKDSNKITSYSVNDVWLVVSYSLTKQGRGSEIRKCLTLGTTPLLKSFPSKSGKVGPHRSRRLARRYLKRQVGKLIHELTFTPVMPMSYFTVTINV